MKHSATQTHAMTHGQPPEAGNTDTVLANDMDSYAAWKSWRCEAFGLPTPAACAYFSQLCRHFIGTRRTSLAVLEVGFGNGQFLGWCRQRDMAVCGVETNPALLARARAAGFDCAASIDELGGHRFDLITLFDVLEHVPEAAISAFLVQLAQRLQPGGRIILRTPNGCSPFGLQHQHGDTTHVSILTAQKFRYLIAPAGLRQNYCGTDMYPLYAGSLRAMPARALRRILHSLCERIVRFVFAPQPRGVLSANLLTVLQKDAI